VAHPRGVTGMSRLVFSGVRTNGEPISETRSPPLPDRLTHPTVPVGRKVVLMPGRRDHDRGFAFVIEGRSAERVDPGNGPPTRARFAAGGSRPQCSNYCRNLERDTIHGVRKTISLGTCPATS
jgi:hypothetical protein